MSSFNSIHEACAKGTVKDVKHFLSCGYGIDSVNDNYQTPLHVAIFNDKKNIVEFLLQRGASTKIGDRHDKTALHVVCDTGNFEIFEMIMDKVDDIDNQDSRQEDTPLHIAVRKNHIQIVEKLLSSWASSHKKDVWERLPLHTAAEKGFYEICDLILTHTDDCSMVNECDNRDQTPLHKAVEHDHYNIAKLLLECGANCNMMDGVRERPLHYACDNGNYQMVKLLLKNFARPNYGTKYDEVPLIRAIQGGHVEIVKLLLKYKARVDIAEREEGKTPWSVAVSRQDLKQPQIYSRPANQFEDSDEDEDEDEEMEVDVEMKEDSEESEDDEEHKNESIIVELLLRSGKFDINKIEEGYPKVTALHMAVSNNNHKLVEFLLENKADPRIKCESNGMEAMHYAVFNNSSRMIKLLLKYGAEINCYDNEGNTPLYYYQRDCKILNVLFENGADINIINNNWKCPIRDSCAKHSCPALQLVKKLFAAGFEVNELDLWQKFFNKFDENDEDVLEYKEEINRIKNIILNYKTKTTLYDMMCEDTMKWASYTENITLNQLYGDQKNFKQEFPHYGFLMNVKFRKGLERQAVMDFAKNTMQSLTGVYLPKLSYEEIFQYFDNSELKKKFTLPVEKKDDKKLKKKVVNKVRMSSESDSSSDDSISVPRMKLMKDSSEESSD